MIIKTEAIKPSRQSKKLVKLIIAIPNTVKNIVEIIILGLRNSIKNIELYKIKKEVKNWDRNLIHEGIEYLSSIKPTIERG